MFQVHEENPETRAVGQLGILFGLVVPLGPKAARGEFRRRGRLHEGHAGSERIVQHIHVPRRHEFRVYIRGEQVRNFQEANVHAPADFVRLRRSAERGRRSDRKVFQNQKIARRIGKYQVWTSSLVTYPGLKPLKTIDGRKNDKKSTLNRA